MGPSRRGALILGTAVAITAVAVAVAVQLDGTGTTQTVTVQSPGSAVPGLSTPVTLPHVTAPAGSTPVDYGQLRLTLPRGWKQGLSGLMVSRCSYLHASYFNDMVFSGDIDDSLNCPIATRSQWLTVQQSATPHATDATRMLTNGVTVWKSPPSARGTVAYAIPAMDEKITAHGPQARRIVDTLEPSALHAVLAARYPTTVPASWHTVTFDHVHVAVPSDWPTNALASDESPPGTCDAAAFTSGPVVDTGPGYEGVVNCPLIGVTLEQIPEDGLWITAANGAGDEPFGEQQHALPISSGAVTLGYLELPNSDEADHLEASVVVNGHRVLAFIGLGDDPTVAESIISSLITTNEPAKDAGTP